jgi:hypothetical protein
MQLNDKKAQKAWQDYEGFIKNLGGIANIQMQQAFKMGYAYGAASNNAAPAQMPPLDQTPTEQVLETKKRVAQATGRRRSEKELINDADIVSAVLKRHGEPMRLQDIIDAVNNAGCDWYPRSASGHMVKVMERIPTIKKVGYGLYEYQQ